MLERQKDMDQRNQVTYSFSNGEKGMFDVMDAAEHACQNRHLDAKDIFLVRLCIEEIVTNALRYGSVGKKAINITISLTFATTGIILKIIDNANPFNPLTEAPKPNLNDNVETRQIGGLGIHLLKSMTKNIQYLYEKSQNLITIQL
ncbi:MAG: ATP-binding protein [Akkermansia sp.]